MAKKIYSCSFTGLKCQIVEVEADITNGLPAFNIVGLGDTSVHESRERVRSSIKNSSAIFPITHKTINLAPAEVPKQGSLFDLPIAVSILLASEQIEASKLGNSIIIGELSLNGDIKKIQGTLAIAQHSKSKGFKKIFLPKENAKEASFIDGLEIYPLECLKQFIDFCANNSIIKPYPSSNLNRLSQGLQRNSEMNTFSKILGLEKAKRALCIAATGGHNVLLQGPPGTGKTILARAFADLAPSMSRKEILETSKIFSIAGLTDNDLPLITKRPFREVHHTASMTAIIGGGTSIPNPGEITLAHNGVLFFDEITEFPQKTLEALRQPLEDKFINLSRANFSEKLPCNFIFIASMNRCACGYLGDPKVKCICSPAQIANYQKKLSGPILDRFDIFLEIPRVILANIFDPIENLKIQNLQKAIREAKNAQTIRFLNYPDIHKNGDMQLEEIRQFCSLNRQANNFLNQAVEQKRLSNRAHLKTLKLARTIADLEKSATVEIVHLAEAINYRKEVRQF